MAAPEKRQPIEHDQFDPAVAMIGELGDSTRLQRVVGIQCAPHVFEVAVTPETADVIVSRRVV